MVDTTAKMKACQRCAEFKPDWAFAPRFDKGHQGSRRGICRDCQNARSREREREGRETELRTCQRCQVKKPMEEFPLRHDSTTKATGVIMRRNVCRSCTNARAKELRDGVAAPSRELKRTLPSYEVLKRNLLTDGMSYAEIAAKYKVCKRTVFGTIKRRAELRGEWPLLQGSDGQRRARRASLRHWEVGNGNAVDATFVAAGLREHLQAGEVRRVFVCGKRVIYGPGTMEQWAILNGFNRNYLRDVLNGRVKRVSVATAVRIYDAIGEEVPDWMRAKVDTGPRELPVAS
jgi:hypothetical protein